MFWSTTTVFAVGFIPLLIVFTALKYAAIVNPKWLDLLFSFASLMLLGYTFQYCRNTFDAGLFTSFLCTAGALLLVSIPLIIVMILVAEKRDAKK